MLIDTHAHVNFKSFKDDSEEVIKRALDAGIQMINVGSQYSTSKRAVEMADKYDLGVWATVGLHPEHLVEQEWEEEGIKVKTSKEKFDRESISRLLRTKKWWRSENVALIIIMAMKIKKSRWKFLRDRSSWRSI